MFSHGLRYGQLHPCVRVGHGFGGFLGLREKVIFLVNDRWPSLPPQFKFLLIKRQERPD